jgi:hypothetical protein
MLVTKSNVEGGFEEGEDKDSQLNECTTWPGRRMPSVHKSTQLNGKSGRSTPQSSCFFLTWVLKLNQYVLHDFLARNPLW